MRRIPLSVLCGVLFVSIHASVKDATGWKTFFAYKLKVSIHASVKDATLRKDIDDTAHGFQSTHL